MHNLSLCAEKLGRLGDAITLEQEYLDSTSDRLSRSERAEALGRTALLRAAAQRQSRQPSPEAQLAATAPATSPIERVTPAQTEPRRPPTPALALIGGGAGLLLMGIGCGIGALSTQATIGNSGPLFVSDYQALVDRGNALNGAAIVFNGVGPVLLTVGAVWAIVDRVRSHLAAKPAPLVVSLAW